MTISNINFDWSVLDRLSIARYVWILSPDIVQNSQSVLDFHNKLTNHLKKQIPLRFRKKFTKNVKSGQVYIGGSYCSGFDQLYQKCIQIDFEYSSKADVLNLSSNKFWKICLLIADTVLHEIIHMRQYRRRNFKILPDYESKAKKLKLQLEQGYLGNSDEIDAYSFNIACELIEKFNSDRYKIINYLYQDMKSKRGPKRSSWLMYLKAFEYDHTHPIIIKLKRKIIRYLPAAETGKPYKNKDWICY